MQVAPFPTRRDEAFRYSDIDALTRVWPIAVEHITVTADAPLSRTIINDAGDDDVVVRHLSINLGAGAKAALHLLNVGGRLGRFTIDVTCNAGSDFYLGAVQIGGGTQTLELVTTVTHAAPGATSSQVVRSVRAGPTGPTARRT
jgi:Fe-S cluster assembly protein SufD